MHQHLCIFVQNKCFRIKLMYIVTFEFDDRTTGLYFIITIGKIAYHALHGIFTDQYILCP